MNQKDKVARQPHSLDILVIGLCIVNRLVKLTSTLIFYSSKTAPKNHSRVGNEGEMIGACQSGDPGRGLESPGDQILQKSPGVAEELGEGKVKRGAAMLRG